MGIIISVPMIRQCDLGLSCLEKSLTKNLNPWLLGAAGGHWLEGEVSLASHDKEQDFCLHGPRVGARRST